MPLVGQEHTAPISIHGGHAALDETYAGFGTQRAQLNAALLRPVKTFHDLDSLPRRASWRRAGAMTTRWHGMNPIIRALPFGVTNVYWSMRRARFLQVGMDDL